MQFAGKNTYFDHGLLYTYMDRTIIFCFALPKSGLSLNSDGTFSLKYWTQYEFFEQMNSR